MGPHCWLIHYFEYEMKKSGHICKYGELIGMNIKGIVILEAPYFCVLFRRRLTAIGYETNTPD